MYNIKCLSQQHMAKPLSGTLRKPQSKKFWTNRDKRLSIELPCGVVIKKLVLANGIHISGVEYLI